MDLLHVEPLVAMASGTSGRDLSESRDSLFEAPIWDFFRTRFARRHRSAAQNNIGGA